MASLVLLHGPDQRKYLPLKDGTVVIGRDESLPLQVLDQRVSRKHLRLRLDTDTGDWLAKDLGSRHGSTVAGTPLQGDIEAVLTDRDRIQIGDSTLVYTTQNFPSIASALEAFRQPGERHKQTLTD
ncbi:FHA domain-containing protein [Mucisphaera sp.]|uniref:FHA domain-containing protein n=1 Tax=Mucisphaera sp. TaxID=2913024 RepID=UPI003D0E263A